MIISGIGWLQDPLYGSVRRAEQGEFQNPAALYQEFEQEGFFNMPLKKVRAFSALSQRFCLASALALRDAGGAFSLGVAGGAKAGILSISRDGCVQGNLDYFRDYIESGRKLGRGNLFIHTLPTSPLAQAAMMFGFKGPNFHISCMEPSLGLMIERAEVLSRQIPGLSLLCAAADEQAVVCFLVQPRADRGAVLSAAELKALAGHAAGPKQILSLLKLPVPEPKR